ncbi:hypothetical protein Tco_0558522 [Tanacetum coccineum]
MEKLRDELWNYNWVRRMEFPRFMGDDIVKIIGKDVTWLIYKHAILQRFGNVRNMQIIIKEILRQADTVVEYSDAFKSLFYIISFLSDMGEDETHFVDLFIEGLHPGIGSVFLMKFLKQEMKVKDLSQKSSEGKGFEVFDAYVKESIEVKME